MEISIQQKVRKYGDTKNRVYSKGDCRFSVLCTFILNKGIVATLISSNVSIVL